MISNRIAILLASAVVIGTAQWISAGGYDTGGTQNVSEMPTMRHYEGSLMSASAKEILFRDQDGVHQRSFPVDEKAKVTRDGGDAKLEDLKNGDRVKVTTEEKLLFKEVATVIEATSESQK